MCKIYSKRKKQHNKKIEEIIGTQEHLGIIIYPMAVHWEPIQRPQHILQTFAERGFLCFFCEASINEKSVDKISKNLYIVYGEENLLPVLQNRFPIVLVTWHNQVVFCDMLPKKYIWFDILDKLDFFDSGEEKSAQKIYKKFIDNADLITYSANNLSKYLLNHRKGIKLNNAVNIDDFQLNDYIKLPDIPKVV